MTRRSSSFSAAVAPIADLQIEYSLLSRGIETNGILDTCREPGIGITAYSVLGRGLIGGSGAVGGSLARMPRFQGDNLDHNRALVTALEEITGAKGVPLVQLAIAWVAARGEHIVPVIGSRRMGQVESMAGANAVELDEAAFARIDAAVPVGAARGDRYPAQFMDQLDSERPAAG
ncbi:aldo/keto reductase [Nocardioides sp. NPDC057772]|uniref:aldo/keto reductase n=1 Tax=Nocardioides sp. NPDC057772 TaxID=3346245 RepID=UPI00366B9653